MRGVHSVVDDLRKSVFKEVALLAYEGGDYTRIDKLPYKIVPGDSASYRDSIFLERAIVTERLRLACGLPMRKANEYGPASDGIEEASVPKTYYQLPLVNVIPFACNGCPIKEVRVSSNCQGCLSHPCQAVCPKGAISTVDGKSFIDKNKCIRCGRCLNQCPYNAISLIERPCAKACGMNAIGTDENGKAKIEYDKCVSCGMCLVNCPFGAIADKSQIFQLIQAIKAGDKVVAIVAPAFVNQFKNCTPAKLRKAMRILGFDDTIEVAIGADMCTIDEAKDFLEKVPSQQPFMATSCCPAWSLMAKKLFPEYSEYISMALTPMVFTARLIKKHNPDVKVVFVGPCVAKKLEAQRKSVRSDVDFVLTFEELQGIFEAKEIDFSTLEPDPCDRDFSSATGAGRGFAVSGGVAAAVAEYIAKEHPDVQVKYECGDGLRECRNMLLRAKAGQRDGYLLEGMACPGGCVAGAGTIAPVRSAATAVRSYKAEAKSQNAGDSKFLDRLEEVLER
jgi:[FeFe] hydrogenase (group B1/B3)